LEYHKIREVIGQMGVWKVVYRALGWTEYLIWWAIGCGNCGSLSQYTHIQFCACFSNICEFLFQFPNSVPLSAFLWKVRAASITCFAGMTSSVFMCFTKEKQEFILSSLVSIYRNHAQCYLIGVLYHIDYHAAEMNLLTS